MKTIFILEDDTDIREMVEYLLKGQYKVQGFASFASFKKGMQEMNRPDLVVLDIMLPDGNGIDICKELKADPQTGHIPVVLMSANINSRQQIGDIPAQDFISKPFDIDDFVHRIQKQVAPGPGLSAS